MRRRILPSTSRSSPRGSQLRDSQAHAVDDRSWEAVQALDIAGGKGGTCFPFLPSPEPLIRLSPKRTKVENSRFCGTVMYRFGRCQALASGRLECVVACSPATLGTLVTVRGQDQSARAVLQLSL